MGLRRRQSLRLYVELEVSCEVPVDEPHGDLEDHEDGESDEDGDLGDHEEGEVDEDSATEQNVKEPVICRSDRMRQRPDYLVEQCLSIAKHDLEEPATVKEALESPEGAKWKEAIKKKKKCTHY